jgi:hypothetical protein
MVRLARHSPIRARPLLGTSAIYNESRRMVERCPSDEVIRATSISTKLPGDHEEDRPDVEAYLYTIASRCAEAKREGKNLLYKTVFGFGPRTADDPPEHKQRSITKRLDQFVPARAEDRLIMKYIETDWSLDVLITGQAEMLIAFPTLPADRHLQLGLKIENRAFVAQAIRWYDDCVLADAKDVTWRPSATVAVQDGVAVPSLFRLRADPSAIRPLRQVDLLRRKRAGEESDALNYALAATINGISAGLRNTG